MMGLRDSSVNMMLSLFKFTDDGTLQVNMMLGVFTDDGTLH